MVKRVVVVNDDAGIRQMLDFLLTEEDWEVLSFSYNNIDLATVQQLKPNLIIIDISAVQGGNGWSFLQALKMEDSTAGIPLLVCTTASRLAMEIEAYLAGRHIRIVRKPFYIDHFIAAIDQAFSPVIVLPILVVEDNQSLREGLAMMLTFEGYVVVTANNGQLALEAVASERYALILLDIAMPVMNGLEFLAAYAEQQTEHSPVIIVSADRDIEAEKLPAFVVSTIRKPYEIKQLLPFVSIYAQKVPLAP